MYIQVWIITGSTVVLVVADTCSDPVIYEAGRSMKRSSDLQARHHALEDDPTDINFEARTHALQNGR